MRRRANHFVNPEIQTADGEPLEAYVPPPVRLGHIPGWLTRRIRLTFPELARERPHYRFDSEVTLHRAARLCWPPDGSYGNWLDHWGSIQHEGAIIFVSEPYPLAVSCLVALASFCDALKVDCTLYAASHHYPTGCLRIEIREHRDSDKPVASTGSSHGSLG